MFDNFLTYFGEQEKVSASSEPYTAFLTRLGGKQFGQGVFNSFSLENVEKWTGIVTEAYPGFTGRFKLFAYDWLGRCFGIDLREGRNKTVLMFEIGTNDVLEIPCDLETFLNEELPLFPDACIAQTFFEAWMQQASAHLMYGRCAGYKVPLFLGGADDISNLEDSDMEVYWGLLSQMK